MFSIATLFANSQRRKEIAVMKQTRAYLLSLDDRLLEDAGFSRVLLEQGIKAWPWRSEAYLENNRARAPHSKNDLKAAASTLRSFSDKDLRDLGIGRGEIGYVVEHGRQGFDCDRAA